MHHITKGSKNLPVVVFIHGFLESLDIWNEITDYFSDHYYCLLVDLPGHGASISNKKVHTMQESALSICDILKANQIKKATLIGHSMGGYVALAILRHRPKVVQGLLLLNSTSYKDSPEKRVYRDRAIRLVSRNKKAFIHMAITNLVSKEGLIKYQKEIKNLISKANQVTSQHIVATLKGIKEREDQFELFKNFDGLKAIFSGEKVTIIPNHLSKSEAALSDSYMKTFKGGHLSYLENRDLFKIELEKFLNEI